MRISEEVLGVLSESVECDDATKSAVIVKQLDRKLYASVNKVLVALGGKWNRAKKAHLFGSEPSPLIEAIMISGEVETHSDIGFFPTPVPLADYLVEIAGVKRGDCCLEPSAGTGRIVSALAARGALITAVERDPRMRQILAKAEMCEIAPYEDFMDMDGGHTSQGFDRIVMNPPFLRVGKGDHLDHVQLAYSLLAHKGRLVSVLPRSVEFRLDRRYKAFREWATERKGKLQRLPEDSFREPGTGVSTNVLIIDA
jgi:predicted RNA methylase